MLPHCDIINIMYMYIIFKLRLIDLNKVKTIKNYNITTNYRNKLGYVNF